MEVVTLVAFYILGLITGIVGMVTLTVMIGKRSIDRRKNELESVGKKMESVNSRMKRVKDITEEQIILQDQISGPQKNALHGRYKNGLIGRVKELETQKNDILKSIITDGFDPEITVIDPAGVVTNTKLSEFLAQTGITIPPKDPKSTKQVGKFTVHKGGKDDGGNTTH